MGAYMRRLIRFECNGVMLSGSIDEGDRSVGLVLVTGGSQVRAGPHRMLHQLAVAAAAAGFAAFRYERRGVGDSDGDDPGYLDSGPDLQAAVAAFRAEAPNVSSVIGFGLCDGATTLALHGRSAGVAALVLANPWLVEVEPGQMAPAATRVHYRDRLLSPAAWMDVLRGKVDILGAVRSLFGSVAKPKQQEASLAEDVATALSAYVGKLLLILSRRDNTAIAARSCWDADAFLHVRGEKIVEIDTDAHTFARTSDLGTVEQELLNFMRGLEDVAQAAALTAKSSSAR